MTDSETINRTPCGHAYLRDKLRLIAPNSLVRLIWQYTDGYVRETEVIVVDYDPETASRMVKTSNKDKRNRTYLLTEALDDVVTISEVVLTSSSQIGTLCDVELLEPPTETLRLTDAGVDIPSYLVGYTGYLLVEDSRSCRQHGILKHGLSEYDDRLLARIPGRTLSPTYDERSVSVQPLNGPLWEYEIIDERTDNETQEPTYDDIAKLIRIVKSLWEAVSVDTSLPSIVRKRATQRLHSYHSDFLTAQTALFDGTMTTDGGEMDLIILRNNQNWSSYKEPFDRVEYLLQKLHNTIAQDESLARGSMRTAKQNLSIPQSELDELHAALTPAVNPTQQSAHEQGGDGHG